VSEPGSSAAAKPKEEKCAARVVGGKVAEDLFNRGLCLPSGTAMTETDLERVISVRRIGKLLRTYKLDELPAPM
jgi:dTDP-4-amino-4,6-dideoxygalactose transaminase